MTRSAPPDADDPAIGEGGEHPRTARRDLTGHLGGGRGVESDVLLAVAGHDGAFQGLARSGLTGMSRPPIRARVRLPSPAAITSFAPVKCSPPQRTVKACGSASIVSTVRLGRYVPRLLTIPPWNARSNCKTLA